MDSLKKDLLIAGRVSDIQANLCYPYSGLWDYTKSRGETFISVKWQLYDTAQNKVILELTTEGFSEIIKMQIDGDKETIYQALGQATRNLLSNSAFYEAVK